MKRPSISELWYNIKWPIHVIGVPEGIERERGRGRKNIQRYHGQNLSKFDEHYTDPRSSVNSNQEKHEESHPKAHQNHNDKQKILRTAREKKTLYTKEQR